MRTATVRHIVTFSLLLLFPGVPAAQAQVCNGGWTFGDNGAGAYRLETVAPCNVECGRPGNENPTLLLQVGRRYQVRVVHYETYPLEVIAKGASAGRDQVLLSMGSDAGTFASDPEVNWQDDGQGTVQFTLTARLFEAMADGGRVPGYRCRELVGTMRGDFAVMWTPPLVERIAHGPIVLASDRTTPRLVPLIEAKSDRLYAAAVGTG